MVMCPGETPFSDVFSAAASECSGTPTATNQSAPAGCAAGSWGPPDGECTGCTQGFYCPAGATESLMCPGETPFSNAGSAAASDCSGTPSDTNQS